MVHRLLQQVAPALIAALMVIAGALVYLQPPQAGGAASGMDFGPDRFQFVMGAGRASGDSLLFERYENGMALASVGGLNIQADVHHWLRFDIEQDENAYAPVFFWRQKQNPGDVSRMELPGPGPQLVDLGTAEQWKGEIMEMGFVFEDPEGHAGTLMGVSLLTDSLALSVSQALGAWRQFEPWSQKSINILYGGPKKQLLALPLVLLSWVILAMLLHAAINYRRNEGFFRFAVVIFLIAWVILDVRWTTNQLKQSSETLKQYAAGTDSRADAPDGYLQDYIAQLKSGVLRPDAGKILLIGDDSLSDYYLLKARYFLLPFAASMWPGYPEPLDPEHLDYVFLFQSFYDEQAARNPRMIPPYVWERIPVPVPWRKNFRLIDVGDFGLVFAVEKPSVVH